MASELEELHGTALALDEVRDMQRVGQLPTCKWGVRRYGALPGPGGELHLSARVDGCGHTLVAEMRLPRAATRDECAWVWYRLSLAVMRRPSAAKVE
jgi:hypothetical protein